MGPGQHRSEGGIHQVARAKSSLRCESQEQRTEGVETNAPTPPDAAMSGVANSDCAT